MSKERKSNDVEVDFDKLARVGNKINELLVRKTKSVAESYAVLRFLCVWYEEDLGIVFAPEFEEELHEVVKKSLRSQSGKSESSTTA